MTAVPPQRSDSILRKRIRKFKTLKRGYYSFLILLAAYVVSFFLPYLVNNKALLVRYQGNYYSPIMKFHLASQFGVDAIGEANYRELQQKFKSENRGNWVLMPIYPYSPTEALLDLPGSPPHRPSREHIFGTDSGARDVFARLAYGFNISLSFAFIVLASSYVIGLLVGATLGYFGGK